MANSACTIAVCYMQKYACMVQPMQSLTATDGLPHAIGFDSIVCAGENLCINTKRNQIKPHYINVCSNYRVGHRCDINHKPAHGQ